MPRRSDVERDRADAGMTLVELTVAMLIFSICMAVFIAGILQMTSTTVRAQTVTDSNNQMRRALALMDVPLRNAEAVNAPGVVGQSWFLESRTPGFDGAAPTCTQWRYSVARGVLEQRRWDGTQAPPVTWTLLARGLSKDPLVLTSAARRPLTMTPTSATQEHQSVVVLLESPRKGTRTSATSGPTGEQVRATFTALNTDASSDGNALFGGVSKSPACSANTTRTE